MRWELFVESRPAPQARPRFATGKDGRPAVVFSPKSEFFKDVVYHASLKRPSTPIEKAIKLTITFCYIPPGTQKYAIYVTHRPDLDNLEKAVMDALTKARVWTDDCLVVKKETRKVYREYNGVSIVVETLKNIKDFYY